MPCANELFGLLRLVSVGLAYLTGPADVPERHRMQSEAWEPLSPCADARSFDVTWTLSLRDDGTAIVDSEKQGQRLQGRWELVDAGKHTYRIDVLAFANDFVVVPTASGCLLGSGTLGNIDLRQSWFSPLRGEKAGYIASAVVPRSK